MSDRAINIGWNKYEVALLIEAYQMCSNGEVVRKDAIATLSKRLRDHMIKLGITISDTYRNENGIALQLSAIENCFTNGASGIPHASNLFHEITDIFLYVPEEFNSLLTIANMLYPMIKEEPKSTVITTTGYEEKAINKSSQQNSKQADYTQEEAPTLANESLTDWYAKKKVKQVLKEKFPRGYRLDSNIETRRMKMFFQELFGEELNKCVFRRYPFTNSGDIRSLGWQSSVSSAKLVFLS